MTSTQYSSGRQLSSLDRIMAIGGAPSRRRRTRAGRPPAGTGQRSVVQPVPEQDSRDSRLQGLPVHRPMRLQTRWSIARKYGVWGGISLPGSDSTPDNLEDAYTFLLPSSSVAAHRARRAGGPRCRQRGASPPLHLRAWTRRIPTQTPQSPKPR